MENTCITSCQEILDRRCDPTQSDLLWEKCSNLADEESPTQDGVLGTQATFNFEPGDHVA
jgi:hypothetical protein